MPITTSDGKYYEDEFEHQYDKIFGKQEADKKDPLDYTDKFNTPLNEREKTEYDKRFSPRDSYDYDMQGWFKANQDQPPNSEGQHYPDTFKKPNHPTFSVESQYNNDEFKGGTWNDNGSFTPGETNLKMHGHEKLQDYFKRVEPGIKLNDQSSQDHKLFFVRHGETEENEENLVRDKYAQLTPKGEKQAESAARQLKSEGVDAIVSSGLDRAKRSAHIIASKLGIVPQFDNRLNTWDVGNLEGTPCKDSDPKIKSAMADTPDKPVAGGESFNDFKDRAFDGIRDAILNNQGKKLAILTHSKVEEALDRWNKTGQDNPDLDVKSKMQTGMPGSVEPFTMKANSTIMQPDNFNQRFKGTGDFGKQGSDTFNQRFQGEPGMLPIGIPGEDFSSIYHTNRDVRQPPPFPGTKEDIERESASHIINMPFNPDKNRDDLNLYNPVGEMPNTMKIPAEGGGRGGGGGGKSVPIGEEGKGRSASMRGNQNANSMSMRELQDLEDGIKAGKSYNQLSKEMDIDKETLRYNSLKGGFKSQHSQYGADSFWTPEKDAKLQELRGKDMSFTEIAKEMGVTRGKVAGRLDRLNKGQMENPSQQQQGKAPVDYSKEEAQLKLRLGQLLRDKAATKKTGYDVESSDYSHYNSQIRELRARLKELE